MNKVKIEKGNPALRNFPWFNHNYVGLSKIQPYLEQRFYLVHLKCTHTNFSQVGTNTRMHVNSLLLPLPSQGIVNLPCGPPGYLANERQKESERERESPAVVLPTVAVVWRSSQTFIPLPFQHRCVRWLRLCARLRVPPFSLPEAVWEGWVPTVQGCTVYTTPPEVSTASFSVQQCVHCASFHQMKWVKKYRQ